MGGSSCHYSSTDTVDNGCDSYPSDSVLSAGAIAGIVVGALVGIAIFILSLVLSYKLVKRNNPSSNQQYHMNVYGLPMNINDHQQPPPRRPEMYIPSKPPMYSDRYEYI
jgi:hypothetical protein